MVYNSGGAFSGATAKTALTTANNTSANGSIFDAIYTDSSAPIYWDPTNRPFAGYGASIAINVWDVDGADIEQWIAAVGWYNSTLGTNTALQFSFWYNATGQPDAGNSQALIQGTPRGTPSQSFSVGVNSSVCLEVYGSNTSAPAYTGQTRLSTNNWVLFTGYTNISTAASVLHVEVRDASGNLLDSYHGSILQFSSTMGTANGYEMLLFGNTKSIRTRGFAIAYPRVNLGTVPFTTTMASDQRVTASLQIVPAGTGANTSTLPPLSTLDSGNISLDSSTSYVSQLTVPSTLNSNTFLIALLGGLDKSKNGKEIQVSTTRGASSWTSSSVGMTAPPSTPYTLAGIFVLALTSADGGSTVSISSTSAATTYYGVYAFITGETSTSSVVVGPSRTLTPPSIPSPQYDSFAQIVSYAGSNVLATNPWTATPAVPLNTSSVVARSATIYGRNYQFELAMNPRGGPIGTTWAAQAGAYQDDLRTFLVLVAANYQGLLKLNAGLSARSAAAVTAPSRMNIGLSVVSVYIERRYAPAQVRIRFTATGFPTTSTAAPLGIGLGWEGIRNSTQFIPLSVGLEGHIALTADLGIGLHPTLFVPAPSLTGALGVGVGGRGVLPPAPLMLDNYTLDPVFSPRTLKGIQI